MAPAMIDEAPEEGGLYRQFAVAMAGAGERPLIRWKDRILSGNALARAVEHRAAVLHHLGVRTGDRVAVKTARSLDQLLLYLAHLRLGAIHLPLNESYGAAETGSFLEDAEPRLLICDPSEASVHVETTRRIGAVIHTLDDNGGGSLARYLDDNFPPAPQPSLSMQDVAAIIYTSGTTGRSKGAMITHGNLITNARALRQAWGVSERDVLLHALPLYHIHGLFIAFNTMLIAGAETILLPAFSPERVIGALRQASVFMGVPTHYSRLLDDARFTADACRSIRLFISGSAPLPSETFTRFEARTGQRILERYGMSECGVICSNPLEGERRPGSVGRPLDGVEVRIASREGVPLRRDEIGGIEVRGPNVFAGYWRMPEKTRADHRPDGHFITGDLGHFYEDGYLHIVGRSKDMVISGGLNVYPREVEALLDCLPGVAESAVIGLPHPDFGEAVVAVVAAADRCRPDPERLIASLRGHLAGFKLPKRIFLVDALPRNGMGKIQKAELRQRYADCFKE